MESLNRSFTGAAAAMAGALAALNNFGRWATQETGRKQLHYHKTPTRKHRYDFTPRRKGVKVLDLQQYEKRYSHCLSGMRR